MIWTIEKRYDKMQSIHWRILPERAVCPPFPGGIRDEGNSSGLCIDSAVAVIEMIATESEKEKK